MKIELFGNSEQFKSKVIVKLYQLYKEKTKEELTKVEKDFIKQIDNTSKKLKK